MLPKSHIFYGAILALASWVSFPDIPLISISLIFFSSVLIDVDHYLWYGFVKKDWSLKNAYYYLKHHDQIKRPLMLFHTIECFILVGMLTMVWFEFYYVLIGMLFHVALDFIEMMKHRTASNREYSLIYHFMKK